MIKIALKAAAPRTVSSRDPLTFLKLFWRRLTTMSSCRIVASSWLPAAIKGDIKVCLGAANIDESSSTVESIFNLLSNLNRTVKSTNLIQSTESTFNLLSNLNRTVESMNLIQSTESIFNLLSNLYRIVNLHSKLSASCLYRVLLNKDRICCGEMKV